MEEFYTSFVPPKRNEERPLRDVSFARVVRSLIEDDLEAERFIRFTKLNYQSALVAYRGEDILGLQLCDYDHHEMDVVLGKQVISSVLAQDDALIVAETLESSALRLFEE